MLSVVGPLTVPYTSPFDWTGRIYPQGPYKKHHNSSVILQANFLELPVHHHAVPRLSTYPFYVCPIHLAVHISQSEI